MKARKPIYLVFGPPGSGKTAQAMFLAQQLKFDHISWGTLCRSKESKEIYLRKLQLINDPKTSSKERSKLIATIIEREIQKTKKNKLCGLILDGFPRRLEEAKELLKIIKTDGYVLKAIIKINPSFETAVARFNNRYICETCRKYFVDLIPTKKSMVCDDDGGKLKKIPMRIENIRNEFTSYLHEVSGAINFLKNKSDLYFDVSGDDEDIVVFSNILIKLRNRTKGGSKIFERKSSTTFNTSYGNFKLVSYQSRIDYEFHLAIIKGRVRNKEMVLTRIHSSCITGDIFGSLKCDCGEQLHQAMRMINEAGCGVILYLFQEGRGINIINKLDAYKLQRQGFDTVEANEALRFPAEMRDYSPVKDILEDMGVKSIVLLTNNPDKVKKITDLGIIVEGIKEIEIEPNEYNKKYLSTKKVKMNHILKKI